MNYRIILVHDFGKTYRDMEKLEENLFSMGYIVENLNFPLTFTDLQSSKEILWQKIHSLKESGLTERDEIVLIGFGFGGVLIRECLHKKEFLQNIDTLLLISSPWNSSTLYRRLKRIFPFLPFFFKPLRAFSQESLPLPRKLKVGLIIGTEYYNLFGHFLEEYNDGYVTKKDCLIAGAQDVIYLPICHREIHKKIGTAKYISNFISKGKFRVH